MWVGARAARERDIMVEHGTCKAKPSARAREAEHERFGRVAPAYPIRVKIEGKGDYSFPEDQQKATEGVKRIARKYGLEVEAVDVTRENALHRILQKNREKIKDFPTLIASSTERIEGTFTEKQVEELFSRLAEAQWQKKAGTRALELSRKIYLLI